MNVSSGVQALRRVGAALLSLLGVPEQQLRAMLSRYPAGSGKLGMVERAAGVQVSVPLERALRRARWRLSWATGGLVGAAATATEVRVAARRWAEQPENELTRARWGRCHQLTATDDQATGEGAAEGDLRAVLAQAPLVGLRLAALVAVVVLVLDFVFFYTFYRQLTNADGQPPWSASSVMAGAAAAITPLLVFSVARPFGVAVSAWIHDRQPADRRKLAGTAVLGVLLLLTCWLFGRFAHFRFSGDSTQVGAISAPTGLLAVLFAVLPVIAAVVHALAETPQVRLQHLLGAAERRRRREQRRHDKAVQRADQRHQRAHQQVAGIIDGLLSLHGDVPHQLVERLLLLARAATGAPDLPAVDRPVLTRLAPGQIGQVAAVTDSQLAPWPLRRLAVALDALATLPPHRLDATDATVGYYLALTRPDHGPGTTTTDAGNDTELGPDTAGVGDADVVPIGARTSPISTEMPDHTPAAGTSQADTADTRPAAETGTGETKSDVWWSA